MLSCVEASWATANHTDLRGRFPCGELLAEAWGWAEEGTARLNRHSLTTPTNSVQLQPALHPHLHLPSVPQSSIIPSECQRLTLSRTPCLTYEHATPITIAYARPAWTLDLSCTALHFSCGAPCMIPRLYIPITSLSYFFFLSFLFPQNSIVHILTSLSPPVHLVSHMRTSQSSLFAFTDQCLTQDASHLIAQTLSPVHHSHLSRKSRHRQLRPSPSPASAPLGPLLSITSLPSPWGSPKSPAPTRGAPGGRRPDPRPRGPVPPAPAAQSHG